MRDPQTLAERRADLAQAVADARSACERLQQREPFCPTRYSVAEAIHDHFKQQLDEIGGAPDNPHLEHEGVIYAGTVGHA